MQLFWRSFSLFILFFALPAFGKEEPAFAFWNGTWDGEMLVYSATGDHLEKVEVQFASEVQEGRAGAIQRINLNCKSSRGYMEKQSGYYLMDARGLRRIVKTSTGEMVSDLRGRSIGPNQIYWFSVDINGVLREAYVESLNGKVAEVHGFKWDGERAGSYRIIEARYTRQDNALAASKTSVP
jgi:hypothetical protein